MELNGGREMLIQDVWSAFCRYAASPDRKRLKDRLRKFLRTAKKLEDVLEFGSKGYGEFVWAIHETMPPTKELESERVRALCDLRANVEKASRGAGDALEKLNKSWRHPKRTFVHELARVWKDHTGEEPGISGARAMTWDNPTTRFAQFVKAVASTVPTAGEFKIGFSDLLRRACG